jgi:hypothetical protein
VADDEARVEVSGRRAAAGTPISSTNRHWSTSSSSPGAKVSPQPLGLDPASMFRRTSRLPKLHHLYSSLVLTHHSMLFRARTVHRKLSHMLHPRDYALSDSPDDFAISLLRLSHLDRETHC